VSADTLCLLVLAIVCVLPAFLIKPDDDDPSRQIHEE
jgi:hypothetical protein